MLYSHPPITLRDYFAAHIAIGLLSQRVDTNESDPRDRLYEPAYPGAYVDSCVGESTTPSELASDAYLMADAMLIARKRTP